MDSEQKSLLKEAYPLKSNIPPVVSMPLDQHAHHMDCTLHSLWWHYGDSLALREAVDG